jgi:hypothetical protein
MSSNAAYNNYGGGSAYNNSGYHYREGYEHSNPNSSNRRGMFSFLDGKWPKAFMAIATIQAIIGLAFEA